MQLAVRGAPVSALLVLILSYLYRPNHPTNITIRDGHLIATSTVSPNVSCT